MRRHWTYIERLQKLNPNAYKPVQLIILNNLCGFYSVGEIKHVEKYCFEAFEVSKNLVEVNNQAYLPNLAETLNILGGFSMEKEEFDEAEAYYSKALVIRRNLSKVYLPDLAETMDGLGVLYIRKNHFENAKNFLNESMAIKMKLSENNPEFYLPDLALTQINLAMLYQTVQEDKVLSIQFADKAITNLISFQKTTYIQNYLCHAYAILKKWDIDVEKYLKKKKNGKSLKKAIKR